MPRLSNVEDILGELEENGAVIIDGFLSPSVIQDLNAEIAPHLKRQKIDHGHVNGVMAAFHGLQTRHLTGVAAISDTFIGEVLLHPIYAALGDHFLLPNCADYLLNLAHILDRGPGAEDQVLHRDQDAWPRLLDGTVMHREFASLVALGEYTREMGATRVVPGSHMWPIDRKARPDEVMVAEMDAGSAVLYLGSTLHGAGANTTARRRRGMHISFCLGWLRTEENQYLANGVDRVHALPRRAQELLGFGIHDGVKRGEGFLGAFDNRNPIDVIDEAFASEASRAESMLHKQSFQTVLNEMSGRSLPARQAKPQ